MSYLGKCNWYSEIALYIGQVKHPNTTIFKSTASAFLHLRCKCKAFLQAMALFVRLCLCHSVTVCICVVASW